VGPAGGEKMILQCFWWAQRKSNGRDQKTCSQGKGPKQRSQGKKIKMGKIDKRSFDGRSKERGSKEQ